MSRLIRIGPAIGGFMLLGWCAVQAQNVPASATPEQLFQARCGTCHLVGGMGTSLLTRRVGQEKSLLAERRDLTSDYIKLVARNGLINMPRLSRAEVTDAELAAIATYLTRSTRGDGQGLNAAATCHKPSIPSKEIAMFELPPNCAGVVISHCCATTVEHTS